jgi:hypothetical protein
MRKITAHVVGAFINRVPASRGNTMTDGHNLYLHGNRIAYWQDGYIYIRTAGWNSVTTRERLNAIPGVSLRTRAGTLYLNGNPWCGEDWLISEEQGNLYALARESLSLIEK